MLDTQAPTTITTSHSEPQNLIELTLDHTFNLSFHADTLIDRQTDYRCVCG